MMFFCIVGFIEASLSQGLSQKANKKLRFVPGIAYIDGTLRLN